MALIQAHATDRVLISFTEHEAHLLQRVVTDVQELLARRAQSEDLAKPQDPALERLFPDGYRDNPDAAQELRELTEESLRQTKSESAATLLATLPKRGGEVIVNTEAADAWLTALNDIRLVLGVRLNVTEDTYEQMEDRLAASGTDVEPDSDLSAYLVYQWISALQEQLIEAVSDVE